MATRAYLRHRVSVMRAASSRIWFPIPNSDQPYHANQVDHRIDSSLEGDGKPIGYPSKIPSGDFGSIHDSGNRSRYWSQDQSRLRTSWVDGYTRLITDRIH